MLVEREVSTLEECLLQLRDTPYEERLQVFEPVRNASRDNVRRAWDKVRAVTPTPGWELDCLQRVEVLPPTEPIECERAIILVLSPGYEKMCEWLLETLRTFGHSPEARIVLFCIDEAYETMRTRRCVA